MSKERSISFGGGLFAIERAELLATKGGGVPLGGQRQLSEGIERPKITRAKKQKHKEPNGDVSHGDEPHGGVSHGDGRVATRRMAAVAWRRVPAEGSLFLRHCECSGSFR